MSNALSYYTGMDVNDWLSKIWKAAVQAIAVAVAARIIAHRKLDPKEILALALVVGSAYLILDFFAPSVAMGYRFGTGLALGAQTVGYGV